MARRRRESYGEAELFLRDLLRVPLSAPARRFVNGGGSGAAARVFDDVVHRGAAGDGIVLDNETWTVVGRPGSSIDPASVREGDLVIRRALGEGRFASLAYVGRDVSVPQLFDGTRLRLDTLVLRATFRHEPESTDVDESFIMPVDAALMWNNGKAYFFKGDQYVRYSVAEDWADEDYPAKIKPNWPGLWESDIGAALMWNKDTAYFFKGDEFIAYSVSPEGGAKSQKIKDHWPGLFERGIDAAVMWNDGKAYFFKGDEYIGVTVESRRADPKKKIKSDWPGLWERDIGAAILWNNNKAYFFKGDKYVRVSLSNRTVDGGYPKRIKDNWPARPWTWLPVSRRSAAAKPARKNFPARLSTTSATDFIAKIAGEQPPKDWHAREKAIFKELVRGNVPDAIAKRLVRIDLSVTVKGRTITGSVDVMPDYLCVGDDNNYVYIPMDPITAQRVAFELDMNLPTARICHAIYEAAGKIDKKNQLNAITRDYQTHTDTPKNRAQTATAAYVEHSDAIKKRMADRGLRFGDLVAGHKKDVVISKGLHENRLRIAFHGFYDDAGVPTEPCKEKGTASGLPGCKERPSLAHGWESNPHFCDYAQGVRLVSDDMIVNGKSMSMRKVLLDDELSALISSEGKIDPPYIPEPPEKELRSAFWEQEQIIDPWAPPPGADKWDKLNPAYMTPRTSNAGPNAADSVEAYRAQIPKLQSASEWAAEKGRTATKAKDVLLALSDLHYIIGQNYGTLSKAYTSQLEGESGFLGHLRTAFRIMRIDTIEAQAAYLAHSAGEVLFSKLTEGQKELVQPDVGKVTITSESAGPVRYAKSRSIDPLHKIDLKKNPTFADTFIGRGPVQVTHDYNYVRTLIYMEEFAKKSSAADTALLWEAIMAIKTDPRRAADPKYAFLFSAAYMHQSGGVRLAAALVGTKPSFSGQDGASSWVAGGGFNIYTNYDTAKANLAKANAGGDKGEIDKAQKKFNEWQGHRSRAVIKSDAYGRALEKLPRG
jgi:hypothetical protein